MLKCDNKPILAKKLPKVATLYYAVIITNVVTLCLYYSKKQGANTVFSKKQCNYAAVTKKQCNYAVVVKKQCNYTVIAKKQCNFIKKECNYTVDATIRTQKYNID